MTNDRDYKKALRWDSGNRRPTAKKENVFGAEYAIPYACITCRTALKRQLECNPSDYPIKMQCPICKDDMYHVGRHFKPPKKSDVAQWNKVRYLIEHGFLFQKIRLDPNSYESVPYPDTLEQAKEFVVKYKRWAFKGAL